MSLYSDIRTVDFSDVRLDWHNFFALTLCLRHRNLLSELIARVQRHSPIKLAHMALATSHRATLPITGDTHSIVCVVEVKGYVMLLEVVE